MGSKYNLAITDGRFTKIPSGPYLSLSHRTMKEENTAINHILVPKHVLLNADEAQRLLSTYNISKKQMPLISVKDPAICHLNPAPGDIVKILRDSPTQGHSFFYRVVVE